MLSTWPQLIFSLFIHPKFANDRFSRFPPNFLLFIPVNKYGLCCILYVSHGCLGQKIHNGRSTLSKRVFGRRPHTLTPDYTPGRNLYLACCVFYSFHILSLLVTLYIFIFRKRATSKTLSLCFCFSFNVHVSALYNRVLNTSDWNMNIFLILRRSFE